MSHEEYSRIEVHASHAIRLFPHFFQLLHTTLWSNQIDTWNRKQKFSQQM